MPLMPWISLYNIGKFYFSSRNLLSHNKKGKGKKPASFYNFWRNWNGGKFFFSFFFVKKIMSWANPRNWFGKKTPQEGKQFIYIYKIVLMIEICMFINPKIIFFWKILPEIFRKNSRTLTLISCERQQHFDVSGMWCESVDFGAWGVVP